MTITVKKTVEKLVFNLPETIGRGAPCPLCGVPVFVHKGREKCGQCDLEKAQGNYQKKVKQHCIESIGALETYNLELAAKKRKKKRPDYKSMAYKD